ncbi:MAG: NADH-quinone oxidoreductase subunit A [Cyclobacteriaceae bacterium]|jgi:NADH-quinone oxidoreductase subunit A|nr:NADH-quinone oxidoreductase subunit A [Cyclobacteriaceae bacterium]
MTEGDFSGWGQLVLFVLGGLAFVGVALFASRLIRPHRPSLEKQLPYESGEQAVGLAWVQFNFRFYVLAILFLLFEVEIILLFPWATVYDDAALQHATQRLWGWFAFGEMTIFLGLLALGLAYAWAKGHLNWARPAPQPSEVKSIVPRALYEAINEKYKSTP